MTAGNESQGEESSGQGRAGRDLTPLLASGNERLRRYLGSTPARWLLVDVAQQRLHVIEDGAPGVAYTISTAATLDGREESGGTPQGIHLIDRKVGAGLPAGTILRSRRPTGEIWQPGQRQQSDLILSRILTLAGQEEGVNRGQGCDSLARYIYIHGTNHEDRLGEAVSHGCIRLANRDVIDLFARVEEGDPVVIA